MGFRDFLYTESRMATMYHISPQSGLKSLRPTGHHRGTQAYPQGMAGVYLAPKFADAVAWGVSHVMYKKGHSVQEAIREAYRQRRRMARSRFILSRVNDIHG